MGKTRNQKKRAEYLKTKRAAAAERAEQVDAETDKDFQSEAKSDLSTYNKPNQNGVSSSHEDGKSKLSNFSEQNSSEKLQSQSSASDQKSHGKNRGILKQYIKLVDTDIKGR